MMGINSDTLTLSKNLTVSNTTQTQNLTVSGIISFPAASINSSCISGAIGGGSGVYMANDITNATTYINFTPSAIGNVSTINTNTNLLYNTTTSTLLVPNITATLLTGVCTKLQLMSDTTSQTVNYLPFTANQSGSGQMKTNANLSFIPSTGNLTCSGLTTLNNITLPTTFITPVYGQLGYIITGGALPAAIGTLINVMSQITISYGVWLFTGCINSTVGTTTHFYASISNTGTINQSCVALVTPAAADVNAGTIITYFVTNTLASDTYQLLGQGIGASKTGIKGQFQAVRIA